jgi:hypothetical protein
LLHNLNILPFLAFIFFACNSTGKKKVKNPAPITSSRLYKDVDPFTLTGVQETTDPSNYPYIKIEELPGKRKLVFVITYRDSVVVNFTRMPDHWLTVYTSKNDTGLIRTREYILPDRIIDLEYFGTAEKTDYHLHDVSVIEPNKITTYTFMDEKGLKLMPGINTVDSVKDKVPVIMTETMETVGNALRTTVAHFDRKLNKITYTDTACFKGGMRSWFWFRHFPGQLTTCY